MNTALPSFSARPTTPAGAGVGCVTSSTLLLLFIIGLLIAWAEGAAASIRRRTETADISDLLRVFGTTDTALILERITRGLLRLRALEAKVLRDAAGLGSDPRLTSRAASAPNPSGRTPRKVHLLPTARTLGRRTAAPNRATGPPAAPNSARANRNGASPSSHTEGHGRLRRADSPLILPQMHADRLLPVTSDCDPYRHAGRRPGIHVFMARDKGKPRLAHVITRKAF